MGRIAKKTPYWKGKMERKGQLQAEAEAAKNEPIIATVKKFLLGVIKKDPFKLIAIVGTAIMVKSIIEANEEIAQKIAGMAMGAIKDVKSQTDWQSLLQWGWTHGILSTFASSDKPTEEAVKTILDLPQVEIIQWLISFAIAYIIVEHAGSLMGLTEKGMLFAVKGLVGLG